MLHNVGSKTRREPEREPEGESQREREREPKREREDCHVGQFQRWSWAIFHLFYTLEKGMALNVLITVMKAGSGY